MFADERIQAIADAHRVRTGEQAVLLCALLLAEETGEAVQQVRRYMGKARRSATAEAVGAELADVVISAALLARLVDVDLAGCIEQKLALGIR